MDGDDLDVRVLLLHPVDETIAPVDAGAAGLIMHHEGDLARITDQLRHLVGGDAGGCDVVRRAGRQRNVAVDTRIEGDHRDVFGLRLLEQWNRGLAVERGKADGLWMLGQIGGKHVDLLVDHRLGLRPFEADLDLLLLRLGLGPELHGLPELMLEALGDEGDIGVLGLRGADEADEGCGSQERADHDSVRHRFPSPASLVSLN